jgi:hypothetical protein
MDDQYGDRRLVVRRRRRVKKRIQDSVGSQHKSLAARTRQIRRAVPAVWKGNIRRASGRDNIRRGTSEVRLFGTKQRMRSEYKGTNCRGARQRARQRMQRASNREPGRPPGWKSIAESSDLLIHYGSGISGPVGRFGHHQKGKIIHHQHSSWGEVGVGAPEILGSFAPYIKRPGLVHWKGSHLIKEPLGTSGLKEGAVQE